MSNTSEQSFVERVLEDKTRSAYIEQSLSRGLEDIKNGRYSSCPDEIERNVLSHFEKLKKTRNR